MHLKPLAVCETHTPEVAPAEFRGPFTDAAEADEHVAQVRAIGGQVCELSISTTRINPLTVGETLPVIERLHLFVATGNCAVADRVTFGGSTGVAPHLLDRIIDEFVNTHGNIRVEQDRTSEYRPMLIDQAHEEALAIEAGYAAERERLAMMMDGTVPVELSQPQIAGSAEPTSEA